MNIEKVLEYIDTRKYKILTVFSIHRILENNEEFHLGVDRKELICMIPHLEESLKEFIPSKYYIEKHVINGDFDGATFTKLKDIEKNSNFITWLA